jgi:hypothetical protein
VFALLGVVVLADLAFLILRQWPAAATQRAPTVVRIAEDSAVNQIVAAPMLERCGCRSQRSLRRPRRNVGRDAPVSARAGA